MKNTLTSYLRLSSSLREKLYFQMKNCVSGCSCFHLDPNIRVHYFSLPIQIVLFFKLVAKGSEFIICILTLYRKKQQLFTVLSRNKKRILSSRLIRNWYVIRIMTKVFTNGYVLRLRDGARSLHTTLYMLNNTVNLTENIYRSEISNSYK